MEWEDHSFRCKEKLLFKLISMHECANKKYQAPIGRNGAYYLPAWIFENSSRRTKLMENIANRRYDEKIPRKRPVGKI
jgi:hypothetical protein